MMKCLFCDNPNVDFTCEKCKSSFCINHSATTEQWTCKKHNIVYSKAKAAEKGYKCTVVENSACPECKSLLNLERLSSGQYYFQCTNCSWNSYLKTPGLFFPSKEQLAREASRYDLVKSLKLCGRRLKQLPGKDICPKCFLDLLQRSPITNFSTIMSSFNLDANQMIKLINKYLEEERIYGIIDERNQMFYYISPDTRKTILTKFHDEGIIKIDDLSTMLDMSSANAVNVVYKIISRYHIKGSFSQDKKFYYTQKYIIDNLIKEIIKQGRISIKDLSNHFGLPQERVKSFCVNLMRAKEINGFFADRGNEIITTEQIFKEIKEFSNVKGLFELNKLASKLKIAVELARKSLHDLIKSGAITGIFTQRREFMTLKYLETKIKELARAYRTMPLKELS